MAQPLNPWGLMVSQMPTEEEQIQYLAAQNAQPVVFSPLAMAAQAPPQESPARGASRSPAGGFSLGPDPRLLQQNREFRQGLLEALEKRDRALQGGINRDEEALKILLANRGDAASQLNLQPLMALTDAWTGSRMAQSYQAPKDALARQMQAAQLQDKVQSQREKLADNALQGKQLEFSAQKEEADIISEANRNRLLMAQIEAQQAKTEGNKRLPAAQVLQVNEGNSMPKLLEGLYGTIEQNQSSFGPVAGLARFNPYNEQSKTIDAQMQAAAQRVGKYLEGGVLRAEDVPKYRAMLPNVSDTPQVARNKLDLVSKMLADKQASDIQALADSGYEVGGLRQPLPQGQIPAAIRPAAQAGDKTVVKRQVNKKTGAIRNVYSDGTTD